MSETQEVIDKIRKMPPRNAEEALERIFLALADKLDAQEAELARLREENERLERQVKGYQHHLRACEQIAGKALGYPWFTDDQKNFPDATEADGVCIGDHVGDTIVEELATRFGTVTRERDEARDLLAPFGEFAELIEQETNGFEYEDKVALALVIPDGGGQVEMDRIDLGCFYAARRQSKEGGE